MNVIDCQSVRDQILDEVRSSGYKNLRLAVIQVGDDPASKVYVRNKVKTGEQAGIIVDHNVREADIELGSLMDLVRDVSNTPFYNGVILQLPLPDHLKPYQQELIDTIPWYKDVDGLTTENIGRLWAGQPCIVPATAAGVMRLLPDNLSGTKVTVINRSNLIGKPLIKLLMDRNATVTVCHSKSTIGQIFFAVAGSQIVITGIGKARYFKNPHMLNGRTWIDCGINRDKHGKLCGDVDISLNPDNLSVTPVPGGVGILTTAQLMLNVVKARELQEGCAIND